MQAIRIKFLPATPYRRALWKASCAGGWETCPFDYSNQEETKEECLRKLLHKLAWAGNWSIGGLPDGSFVAIPHSLKPVSIEVSPT